MSDRDAADRLLRPSLDALEEPVCEFLLSNIEGDLGRNVASLYNTLARLEGPTVRAFVHSDVSFAPDLVERLMSSIDGLDDGGEPWGALGMVGRSWDGDYVWCHDVDGPTAVCTLDSCFLVTRTDLRLWFDAGRFDEFHCFVEDYCLQCHDAGLGVWVVPVPVDHEGVTFAREGSRWGRYDVYRKRLDKKWRRRFPGFTTV